MSWQDLIKWEHTNDLPDPGRPLSSVILPPGIPPCFLLEMYKSNISSPVLNQNGASPKSLISLASS
jgi:hypothetical protein